MRPHGGLVEAPGHRRFVLATVPAEVGRHVTAEAGMVRGYSPSGRRVIIEPALPFANDEPADWKTAKVVDVQTGQIVNRIPSAAPVFGGIPTSSPLLGWYDDRHVVRFAPDSACQNRQTAAVASSLTL